MEKKKVLTILFALILLLSVITITYAYFVSGVNNTNQQTATLTAGTMELTFEDNDTGIAKVMNFGETITKKFTIENTGTLTAYAKISWLNIINTYLEGSLTYTLEYSTSENGTYTKILSDENVPRSTTASTIELADGVTVPAGTKLYYNLHITLVNSETVDQTADLSATFITYFTMESGTKSVINSIIASVNTGSPTFSSAATTDEGIYAMVDDYGTSYYFRGAVENNYVKFAGYYWRIIRVNGDGSLRIIYDGTSAHSNGENSTDRQLTTRWFNDYYDNAYVGYMYGLEGTATDANRCLKWNTSTSAVEDQVATYTTQSACETAGGKWTTTAYAATHANVGSSAIKSYLDKWYQENLLDYEEAISDTVFCNDRSIYSGLGYVEYDGSDDETYYSASNRINTYSPSLQCSQKNDSFTVSDTIKGNGDLTYPIGLITADEISLAGIGSSWSNSSYYLYKGDWYWTMTPFCHIPADVGAFVFGSDSSDSSDSYVSNNGGVAPVINLSAEYCQQLGGSGTATDPYTA